MSIKNIKRFNKIPDYVAGLDINDVKKKYGLNKIIKLASNENPYPLPAATVKKICKFVPNVRLYPDMEYKQIRFAIAEFSNVKPDNIILGNGSDEIFDFIFKAFLSFNSKVVMPAPSFAIYKILSGIYNSKVNVIPLQENNDFQYDVDKFIKALSAKPDAVILCNPNNPTGTYINDESINRIIENLSDNTILIVDEAYFNFVTKHDFPDMIKLIKKYKNKNIIVTRTFSKLFGIAGLRLGYGIANKEIIKILNKVRMPFNINTVAEKTASLLIKDAKYINDIQRKINDTREFFCSELDKLGIDYIPSQTNFILVKCNKKGETVFKEFLKYGIIIRSYKDKELRNYVRVTIGTKKEMILFLKILKKLK